MQPNQPGQQYNPQVPPQQGPTIPPQQQPQTASQLKAHHHSRGLLIGLIIVTILLIASISFGVWAFMERTDYKDNVDNKVATAVDSAVEKSKKEQEADFVEREKKPYKTYNGPSQFGSVSITYPKTWSAYVDESGSGNTPVEGYMHPNYVPGIKSGISFALKFEVIEKPYNDVLDSYSSDVKQGTVNVSPIKLKNVPSVAGSRLNGEVEREKQGSLVLFPIRDKTLKVSVLSDQFVGDFENIILPNLSFTP